MNTECQRDRLAFLNPRNISASQKGTKLAGRQNTILSPPLITLPSNGTQASTVRWPSAARLGKRSGSIGSAGRSQDFQDQEHLQISGQLAFVHRAEDHAESAR
jgi:hypothetical protein